MPDGPATFETGAFVILTTDPGRSGVVRAGEKRLAGRRAGSPVETCRSS